MIDILAGRTQLLINSSRQQSGAVVEKVIVKPCTKAMTPAEFFVFEKELDNEEKKLEFVRTFP